MLQLPPLSLYIHIPWCIRKCPYCDFNSHTSGNQPLPESAYINRLLQDFSDELPGVQGRTLQSIFIGGGTPSLFSPEAIERLLNQLAMKINFSADIEITMEANPGTFEQHKFTAFKSAGINRLSLGIQSFHDHQLKKLGRIHGRKEALKAASSARKAGFDNINFDLMHGLPEQTPALAMDDLITAVSFAPEHISWYQLTIEPNTVFYSKPPCLPVEDVLWKIQEQGSEYLQKNGYQQYEISAWSQPEKASLHNLNYWRFGDYIGIGAGAHGKITDLTQLHIMRRRKKRMPSAYLADSQCVIAGENVLTACELPLEFFLNTLRLKKGVLTETFSQYTGLPLSVIEASVEQAQQKGWMEKDKNRLQPTETGNRFLNDLLAVFMP
ncbi:MAG: radical SAM family heme chaperone HemW [Endozoicomonadaceae bacterium]|nr:radical SAM family heme chaperone HemW [Endozoicomonadaceae bacterium]